MSLRPKENLEYQEKTSGVSSSWNSLQIGQKWTLAGDDGRWTSGGGFTNPPDVKDFWTFLNMFNIFKHFLQFIYGRLQMSGERSMYSPDIEYLYI